MYTPDEQIAAATYTLPIESVLRVWDVFLFEGAKILHRVGIALL